MIKLHQITIPDTAKAVDIRRSKCVHCDKQLNQGDAFVVRADGYFERSGYEPCTRTAQG